MLCILGAITFLALALWAGFATLVFDGSFFFSSKTVHQCCISVYEKRSAEIVLVHVLAFSICFSGFGAHDTLIYSNM